MEFFFHNSFLSYHPEVYTIRSLFFNKKLYGSFVP